MKQKHWPNIEDLEANHRRVSVPKTGFFLCRQGEVEVLLGTHVYSIHPNQLCIYTPHTFLQVLRRSEDLQGILIEEDMESLHDVLQVVDVRRRMEIRRSPCVEVSSGQADRIILLSELLRAEEEQAPQSGLLGRIGERQREHLLSALCMEIFRVYFGGTFSTVVPQKEEVVLNKFLVSLYEHVHQERTVQYYAAEQHLSPYYFSTLIRTCSGKSALQWIEDVCMNFAKQYLDSTDMSIKEIGVRLNFPDQSTFGRYFKHHAGMSPSFYREKRKANLT